MLISFAWTTDAFLADQKTVTRRDWSDRYAQQWCKAWDQGRLIHDAYDRLPRVGGKKVGQLELTARPYKEALRGMPNGDLAAEGGLWASKKEYIDLQGGDPERVMWVIRFRRLHVEGLEQ